MPYLPFPDHWPVFMSKDKIGDWLECYAKIMEFNVWGSTEAIRAAYDERLEAWDLQLVRNRKPVSPRPKHLVIATWMSGLLHVPDFPEASGFRGVQWHSSQFPGGQGLAGKKCGVIGSNNRRTMRVRISGNTMRT